MFQLAANPVSHLELLRSKIEKNLRLYGTISPPNESYKEHFFYEAQSLIRQIKIARVPEKSEARSIEATDDPVLKPLRDARLQANEELKKAQMTLYITQKKLAETHVTGFIQSAGLLQIQLPRADERYQPVMVAQLMSVSNSILNYIAKLPQEIQLNLVCALDTFVDSIIVMAPMIEAVSESSRSMPDETPNLEFGDSDSLINTLSELINQTRWDDKGSGFSGTFFGDPPHGIMNMRNILNNSRLDNNQKWDQIKLEAGKRAVKQVSGRDPEVQNVYNIIAQAPSNLVFASSNVNFLSRVQELMTEQAPRQLSSGF